MKWFKFIKILFKIKKLDNNIGDEGCKYLSEGLKINNSLQQLNIECNL